MEMSGIVFGSGSSMLGPYILPPPKKKHKIKLKVIKIINWFLSNLSNI